MHRKSVDTARGSQLVRIIWQVVILPLPWTVRRHLLQLLAGFTLAKTSRIGWSLIRAESVTLAPGSMIGHLSIVKGLSHLELGTGARIGNLNWITAVPLAVLDHFTHVEDRDPSLRLGEHAAITHRHLIDCTGGIDVGAFATIGGWHSQIVSHGFAFRESRQDAAPITVGAYAFVGSRSVLLKGCDVPERSILGAGSVYDQKNQARYGLYRGNPATRVAELSHDLGYFSRTTGFVQ